MMIVIIGLKKGIRIEMNETEMQNENSELLALLVNIIPDKTIDYMKPQLLLAQ